MPSDSRRRSSRSLSPGPSRRRSRSPDDRASSSKHHKSSYSRRRHHSDSEDGDAGPPPGVNEIDDDDYFQKANEFKLWLDEEKGKRLDQLDGRRYFRKFVKAWNRGKLPTKYYAGISGASLSASTSSAHKWNFSKATQRELDDASSIRKSIDSTGRNAPAPSSRPTLGPAMPPGYGSLVGTKEPVSALEALQQSRDEAARLLKHGRDMKRDDRQRSNRDARDDERDNRATGRDRLVEKRKEGNADRKEYAAAREGGGMMEFDDNMLMGGGGDSSFKKALADRDRAKNHPKRLAREEEKKAVMADKASQFRSKEQQTMDSLRALAAARFG